jgi:hypothetical protein
MSGVKVCSAVQCSAVPPCSEQVELQDMNVEQICKGLDDKN